MPDSNKIPRYMIGKHVTSCLVSPVTLAADGTVTVLTGSNATDLASTGVFDELTISAKVVKEQIVATNAQFDNEAITLESCSVTVGEIKKAGGPSGLWTLFGAYDYFRVQAAITDPVSGTVNVFAGVFLRGDCNDGLVQGKNGVKLEGGPCGHPIYYGLSTGIPF